MRCERRCSRVGPGARAALASRSGGPRSSARAHRSCRRLGYPGAGRFAVWPCLRSAVSGRNTASPKFLAPMRANLSGRAPVGARMAATTCGRRAVPSESPRSTCAASAVRSSSRTACWPRRTVPAAALCPTALWRAARSAALVEYRLQRDGCPGLTPFGIPDRAAIADHLRRAFCGPGRWADRVRHAITAAAFWSVLSQCRHAQRW